MNTEIDELKVLINNHKEAFQDIEGKRNLLKIEWESFNTKSDETLQRIMGHLDVDLDNDNIVEPSEYRNYLKINSEKTKLDFLDCNGKKVPSIKISRETVFNRTLEDGQIHNELYDFDYKSSETCAVDSSATITNIKYFVEKNTPIVQFTIRELGQEVDKETHQIVDIPTGKFFHVKLKQNKAPFGIEYVGEFDYTDNRGNILRTGIMKWAFIK